MRLRDTQRLLRLSVNGLNLAIRDLGGGNVDARGAASTRRSLATLAAVPHMAKEVQAILENGLFSGDSTVLTGEDGSELAAHVEDLRHRCELLLAFLDETLPNEPPLYFAVRMPQGRRSADEASKLLRQFHLALDQPLRMMGHPPLAVSFDVGSWWIEAAAATMPALTIVGALLGLAISRTKAEQQRLMVEQELARLHQQVERTRQEVEKSAQETARTDQERYRAEIARLEFDLQAADKRRQIAELETDAKIAEFVRNSPEPHEVAAALALAVNELAELYDEGSKFRIQVGAPTSVKSAFPAEAYNLEPAEAPEALLVEAPSAD